MIPKRWRSFISWLHRLDVVPGEWEDEIAALKPKYADQDALQAILDNPDAQTVLNIAASNNLDAKRLAEFLGASLQRSSEPLLGGRLSRHWADLIFFAGIAALATLPILAGRMDAHKEAILKARKAKIDEEPQVIAKRDLPLYVPLKLEDIAGRNTKGDGDANKIITGMVGRYPVKFIKEGIRVHSEDLSVNKFVPGYPSVVRLVLKVKPELEGRKLPASADLLISNRGTQPSGEVVSILLLNLEADGLTAIVAVPEGRTADLAKWIGNSDAYVSFAVP